MSSTHNIGLFAEQEAQGSAVRVLGCGGSHRQLHRELQQVAQGLISFHMLMRSLIITLLSCGPTHVLAVCGRLSRIAAYHRSGGDVSAPLQMRPRQQRLKSFRGRIQ